MSDNVMQLVEHAQPPFTWVARVAYPVGGVLMPALFLFAFELVLVFDRDMWWQDGTFPQHAVMLWDWSAVRPFVPLWVYAMASLMAVVIAPTRCREWFVVRWGIYTGLILTLQSLWLALPLSGGRLGGATPTPGQVVQGTLLIVLPIAVVLVGLWALAWATRRWGAWRVLAVVGIAVGVAEVLGAATCWLLVRERALALVLVYEIVGVAILLLGPGATVSAYGLLAFWVWRTAVRPIRPWMAAVVPVAWSAGYVVAWRMAILAALAAYAKLPKTKPPDGCYVATAAARGHDWFVGAERVETVGGRRVVVNEQLRHLKAGEIAFRAVWPGAHRACRWVYDRVGPMLARGLGRPVLADLAYVGLKPMEWLAWGGVRVLGGVAVAMAKALYQA